MFTFIGGGSSIAWFVDFEWDGSHAVTAGNTVDFRALPGWTINDIFRAPIDDLNSTVTCPAGVYLVEMFDGYQAAITTPFRINVSNISGSVSIAMLLDPGTSPSGGISSPLKTMVLESTQNMSLSVTNDQAHDITMTYMQIRLIRII